MNKEFEEWWLKFKKSTPWMAQRGLDEAIKAIAYSAWDAGWDASYDSVHWEDY